MFLTSLPFTKLTEIDLGLFSIQAWGLMVALGMILGLMITIFDAKRAKFQNSEFFYDVFFWLFIGAMLGGRLFYVFLFPEGFIADPLSVFYFWEGGMVFYGGILGAIIAIYTVCKLKKVSLIQTLDMMAPGMAFGTFIGRIGCYLIGDHIGSPSDFPLSSVYTDGLHRHEPSLYLSLNGLILFFILWSIRKKLQPTRGAMLSVYLTWYAGSRFLLDFTRATDLPGSLSDPRFYGMTISQIISLLVFLVGLPWMLRNIKKSA